MTVTPESAAASPIDAPSDGSPSLRLLDQVCRELKRGLLTHRDEDERRQGSATLLEDVDSLYEALAGVLRTGDTAGATAKLPMSFRPLAHRTRRLLLFSEEESRTVLNLLRALELLEVELGSDSGPDPDTDLRGWLMRPDSFELLVEVAHDLRSPLTSILFLSEAMADGDGLDDLQRSQLGLIYSAALGLVSVTSNVLELARGGKGLVDEAEAGFFSPAEVISGVVQMVQPMAESKGVELRTTVSERDRAYGHSMALSRILLNLTTNGLKFTESGYVEIGVDRKRREVMEFYVRDTGRGIPERQLSELFHTFRKRAGGDGEYFFSGSGLGLSICERLLRGMDSSLEVETRPGWGTRFSFELRADRAH